MFLMMHVFKTKYEDFNLKIILFAALRQDNGRFPPQVRVRRYRYGLGVPRIERKSSRRFPQLPKIGSSMFSIRV